MATFGGSKRWRQQQPQTATPVDPNSAWGNRLLFAHAPFNGLSDVVKDNRLQVSGDAALGVAGGELAFTASGGATDRLVLTREFSAITGQPFTMLARVRTTDTVGAVLSLRDSTTSTPIIAVGIGHNGVLAVGDGRSCGTVRDSNNVLSNTTSANGVVINDGKWHTVGIRRRNNTIHLITDKRIEVFATGASGPVGNIIFSAGGMSACTYFDDPLNDTVGNLAGAISFGAFWNRALTDSEIHSLAESPWQVFMPTKQVFYIDAPAGGGVLKELAGAALSVATASGDVTHSVPIAGASVATATANGAITQTVPVAGAATATATANGGLSISVPLSGTAVAQALAQAGITQAVPLAGSAVTTQYGRPVSDVLTTGWTMSTGIQAWPLLNEVESDFSTYATSNGVTTDSLIVALGPVTDPEYHNGHRVYVNAWCPEAASSLASIALYQGNTLIAGGMSLVTDVPKRVTRLVTTVQAALITDYNALEVRVSSAEDGIPIRVSNIAFVIEQAAVANAAGELEIDKALIGDAMTAVMRPSADIAAGTFVASNAGSMFAAIGEAVPDDSVYVYNTSNNFVWSQTALGAIRDPKTTLGHEFHYRAWKANSTATYLFLYLQQGETIIYSDIREILSLTPQDYVMAVTPEQAALITDYSALEIRMISTSGTVNLSWFEYAINKGAQAAATGGLAHGVPLAANVTTTYARPIADMAVSNWTASSGLDKFALLDEVVADDSDYIYTDATAIGQGIRLAPMTDPVGHGGHRIAARMWATNGVGYVWVSLYDGQANYDLGEPLTTQLCTLTDTPTLFRLNVSVALAATIQHYDDLIVYFYTFGANNVRMSQLYFATELGGSAVAAGGLAHGVPLAGAAAAQASSSGSLGSAVIDLAGSASGQTMASGTVQLTVSLNGAAMAQALTSAAITKAVPLSGGSVASALASGSLTKSSLLTGSAVAQAAASGALLGSIALAGASLAVADASGNITKLVPMSGSALGASSANGNLAVFVQLSGAALASALSAAGLSTTSGMAGLADADAEAGGNLTLHLTIDGDALAASLATGSLSVSTLITMASMFSIVIAREDRIWKAEAENRTVKITL